MNFKHKINSISGWLLASYSLIILVSFLGSALCIITIRSYISLDRIIVKIEEPAIEKLNELKSHTKDLQKLSSIYIYQTNPEDKTALVNLVNKDHPDLLMALTTSAASWKIDEQRAVFEESANLTKSYLADIKALLFTLNTVDDYSDDQKVDYAIALLEGKINLKSSKIQGLLSTIISEKEKYSEESQAKKESAFLFLVLVLVASLAIIMAISFAIMRFSKSLILDLISNVNQIVVTLGEGEIPNNPQTSGLREINLLNAAINSLVLGIKNKIDFAQNIGQGIYDAKFEILGNQDILGKALQKMSDSLKGNQEVILEKNRKITDSITYSQRIQNSLLPTEKVLKASFPDSFIINKPKDIVSGDFLYHYRNGDYTYVAVVDCTGHGVPGALMSFIGYFTLNRIMNGNNHSKSVAELLNQFNREVEAILNPDEYSDGLTDGMDIALCKFNTVTRELQFAGARRPVYLINNGEFIELKADKYPIGGKHYWMRTPFVNHTIQLSEGDSVILTTDGFQDQFGGELGNQKFMSKRLREIISTNRKASMEDLRQIFDKEFYQWKGDQIQIDDVLVIGFKVE